MARRIWDNLGTMLLALFLAGLVWVVAINEQNPIEQRTLGQPVTIDIRRPPGMIITNQIITRTQVTVQAPRLTWDRLGPQQIDVVADLTGLEPGVHVVELVPIINVENARVVAMEPPTITVHLETSDVRTVPISLDQNGTPAPGYEVGTPIMSTEVVTLTGPASAVASVSQVVARYSVEGLRRDFNSTLTLTPLDTAGNLVTEVDLQPETVQVQVPVTQKVGFRDIAVKVVYTGQVASGYQVTNITVAPNIVTVSSANPRLVEQMPGFVETQLLDLTGASDDIVRRLPLLLPPGVIVEGDDQTVLVQVNIAAIEYSVTVERVLEIRGLSAGLGATASPETVDVIVLGPLTVLDNLSLQDVRVVLDLSGLGPGTYQVVPEVELLFDSLRAENVLPNRVEVVIGIATPTPTFDPNAPTEEPTPTATVTPRPTLPATPIPTLPLFTPTSSPTPTSTDEGEAAGGDGGEATPTPQP